MRSILFFGTVLYCLNYDACYLPYERDLGAGTNTIHEYEMIVAFMKVVAIHVKFKII